MTEPAVTIRVDPSNLDAAKAWSGADGNHWVEHAERYDRSIARHHRRFIDAADLDPDSRVLDVGCGSGQTTRDAARRASNGHALGVDISAPLIENSRRIAQAEHISNISFLQADAQIHRFDRGTFDAAISRTGAMFFGDPVAAFTNIGRALRPGGRLSLLVWQEIALNHWIRDLSAALAVARPPVAPPPGAPGPFAFADPARVREVLSSAGFGDVSLEDVREPMYFGSDVDDAFAFITSMGFTKWMLSDLDDGQRNQALRELRASIGAHETSAGVEYQSATWIITATRP